VWVRATFDDSVVFEVETAAGYGTYEATYTIGAEGIVLGEPVEVTLAEVVTPKSGPQAGKVTTDTNPETKAAAPAAATSSPAAVDVGRAQALAAQAELALLD